MRLSLAIALICALASPAVAGDTGPRLVSEYILDRAVPGFAGLSAIDLTADGTGFVMLSDRNRIFHGTLTRQDGRITGVTIDRAHVIGTEPGFFRDEIPDSEGVALAPDGRTFLSFEGTNRVAAYDGIARALPDLPGWRDLDLNGGLEALAIDAQGALYTLPERSGHASRPFPVWRFAGGRWQQAGAVPRLGGYLPVGADFGPDGRLWLLERRLTVTGFSSRVRVFDVDQGRIGGGTTVLETAPLTHGNLEGLAVWRDPTGAIRLTMVADDNFRDFQRSEIVEYVLPPDSPLAGGSQTH